jgi:hypothetical protein
LIFLRFCFWEEKNMDDDAFLLRAMQEFERRQWEQHEVANGMSSLNSKARQRDVIVVDDDDDDSSMWLYPCNTKYSVHTLGRLARKLLLNNGLLCAPLVEVRRHVAAVLLLNFARLFPSKKVLYVASTKAKLVAQSKYMYEYMSISARHMCIVDGGGKRRANGAASRRKRIWQQQRDMQWFFANAKGLLDDVQSGLLNAQSVALVVFDDAHLAANGDAHTYAALSQALHERTAPSRLRSVALAGRLDSRDAIGRVLSRLRCALVVHHGCGGKIQKLLEHSHVSFERHLFAESARMFDSQVDFVLRHFAPRASQWADYEPASADSGERAPRQQRTPAKRAMSAKQWSTLQRRRIDAALDATRTMVNVTFAMRTPALGDLHALLKQTQRDMIANNPPPPTLSSIVRSTFTVRDPQLLLPDAAAASARPLLVPRAPQMSELRRLRQPPAIVDTRLRGDGNRHYCIKHSERTFWLTAVQINAQYPLLYKHVKEQAERDQKEREQRVIAEQIAICERGDVVAVRSGGSDLYWLCRVSRTLTRAVGDAVPAIHYSNEGTGYEGAYRLSLERGRIDEACVVAVEVELRPSAAGDLFVLSMRERRAILDAMRELDGVAAVSEREYRRSMIGVRPMLLADDGDKLDLSPVLSNSPRAAAAAVGLRSRVDGAFMIPRTPATPQLSGSPLGSLLSQIVSPTTNSSQSFTRLRRGTVIGAGSASSLSMRAPKRQRCNNKSKSEKYKRRHSRQLSHFFDEEAEGDDDDDDGNLSLDASNDSFVVSDDEQIVFSATPVSSQEARQRERKRKRASEHRMYMRSIASQQDGASRFGGAKHLRAFIQRRERTGFDDDDDDVEVEYDDNDDIECVDDDDDDIDDIFDEMIMTAEKPATAERVVDDDDDIWSVSLHRMVTPSDESIESAPPTIRDPLQSPLPSLPRDDKENSVSPSLPNVCSSSSSSSFSPIPETPPQHLVASACVDHESSTTVLVRSQRNAMKPPVVAAAKVPPTQRSFVSPPMVPTRRRVRRKKLSLSLIRPRPADKESPDSDVSRWPRELAADVGLASLDVSPESQNSLGLATPSQARLFRQ